jgi:hypothetical protein
LVPNVKPHYIAYSRILRVDLTRGEVRDEDTHLDSTTSFLDGSGLATRYLVDLALRGAEPLRPDIPPIFMTGPQAGQTAGALVLLNGQHLAQAVRTQLHDGDVASIFPHIDGG